MEIAGAPDAISPPIDLARRLEALAMRFDAAIAVVSGRSISNLQQFLGPMHLTLAGSHGGHIISADGTSLREATPLPQAVGQRLKTFAQEHGLLYEAKTHGAALHYRRHPHKGDLAQAFALALAEEHALATKTGKCVIELLRSGMDKGGAVELLYETADFAGTVPVFIGDDVTDEDGFAACARLGGFGIAVGERPSAGARYALATVKDVHSWLEL